MLLSFLDGGRFQYLGRIGPNRHTRRPCKSHKGTVRGLGVAGPGPSYMDPGSGGPENDLTNRNTTFMTWNLMHLAHMIRSAKGIPALGNQRSKWDAGCRFDFENREYR